MIIERMEEPTIHDQLPYGTVCRVLSSKEFYIQSNPNDSSFPRWMLLPTPYQPQVVANQDIE